MEKIKAVAVIDSEGNIHTLPRPARHADVMLAASETKNGLIVCKFSKQGFITTEDRFVDRKEARRIAARNNQIANSYPETEELYSENLW